MRALNEAAGDQWQHTAIACGGDIYARAGARIAVSAPLSTSYYIILLLHGVRVYDDGATSACTYIITRITPRSVVQRV